MTKNFFTCACEHIKRYPCTTPQDLYKLCYQAAFGAEHMIQDEIGAWEYLKQEYEQLPPERQELLEWIGAEVVRVNLAEYKLRGLSLENLFHIFVESARQFKGSMQDMEEYQKVVGQLAKQGSLPFLQEDWNAFCEVAKLTPVHHSQTYKEKYKPAYRVIAGEQIKKIEITK